MVIRSAKETDISQLHAMLQQLAEFEHLEHRFVVTQVDLHTALFASQPQIHVRVACDDDDPMTLLGYAFFYFSFGTFSGKSILHIEDLYVLPDARGQGLGLKLFKAIRAIAEEKKCQQMEWHVLHWNEKAIAFYENTGAEHDMDWQRFILPLVSV